MIDFNKIPIAEKKLGTYGDTVLVGGIQIEKMVSLNPEYPDKDFCSSLVKQFLHDEIYGDLKEPFFFLEDIIKKYVLPNMGYSQHPYFVDEKEIKENLDKIRKILQDPE